MSKEILRCNAIIERYVVISSADAERLANARGLVVNEIERLARGEERDNGLFGKVFELLMRPSYNTNTMVAGTCEVDGTIFVDGVSENIEFKTGLGRIGSLIGFNDRPITADFVVYVGFLPKMVKGEKFELISQVVIVPREQFLKDLTTSHHSNGEPFIRMNKKFWERLKDWYIPYDRNAEYTADDFEGLEF